jgi:(E)-4-hydroxy-3-methylbut-2-enyl-diphosphate synthase
MRRTTKRITVRGIPIGGGAPIPVQSMTNTRTEDVSATLRQIEGLAAAGCDIVRLAVPNRTAARALREIRRGTDMPLVADIHFDYKLALMAVDAGVDKLRINPGNIGAPERVRAVAEACMAARVPIRIGVNGGSLEAEILEKYGYTARALCESALGHAKLLEDCGMSALCLSVKASDPALTVEANRLLSSLTDYPLHLGVTEAGTEPMGLLRSAAGIGSLLLDGIGDTIRISLTAPPEDEARAGVNLLRALTLRRDGPRFISCPSCGRCEYDLIGTAAEAERLLSGCGRDITVAVMGCVVNGPGEASRADYGVAGGKTEGVLFRHGEIVGRVPVGELAGALAALIETDAKGTSR